MDAIIDNLGGGAVGNVNVQQPGGVVAAAPSGSGSGSGSGGGEGAGNGGGQGEGDGRNGAVGLCGSYRCLRGR